MIDISTHRHIMLNILKDIYKNKRAASWLGFKGGTCLYFFHNLPRFSTDLDFNLLISEEDFQPEVLQKILKPYITIKNYDNKKHTWFWMGAYNETNHNIKIEISKRSFPDEYEIKNLYGLSVKCMKPAFLFAHKLCAITDRKTIANRDIFDAHFMFKNQIKIADEIIESRTKLKTKDYFKVLTSFIPKQISKRGILEGLGEVLEKDQKKWVKTELLEDLLFYLKSY